jgi:hypothetical protein
MDFFAKLMGKNPKKYKVFFCVITHTHILEIYSALFNCNQITKL